MQKNTYLTVVSQTVGVDYSGGPWVLGLNKNLTNMVCLCLFEGIYRYEILTSIFGLYSLENEGRGLRGNCYLLSYLPGTIRNPGAQLHVLIAAGLM